MKSKLIIPTKADRGIPIPPPAGAGRAKGALRLAMERLNVNDSFFVGTNNTADAKRFVNNVFNMRRKIGIGITTRIVTENGKEGVRIWRIR